MIFTILFYIIGWLISLITFLLPIWQPYPHYFLDGCTYIGRALTLLNVFVDAHQIAAAIIFLSQYFAMFLTAKILIAIVSAIRGHKIYDL